MSTLFYVPQFKTTTLNVGGGIDDNQTTGIVVQSVTGIDITKPGIICVSWADPLDTGTAEWISYTSIDGSNELQGVVRGAEDSTARAHSNGATVAYPISKAHINNINRRLDGTEPIIGAELLSDINAPRGFLINGKIVPTVSSNDLIVNIKGVDGNAPSATNPVYCRIGDTVRSITGALSVTLADATNWFNLGAAATATKETDLFVYLGYNATDGVVLGISRLPHGTKYASFSTTSTEDRYCAISTITNAAATDAYENIGRFAATLSAGAGYTWTVPTYDNDNLIQRPIYSSRLLDFVPAFTGSGSMTIASLSIASAQYKVVGSQVFLAVKAGFTTGGSASTDVQITVPLARVATTAYQYFGAGEGYASAKAVTGHWNNTSTTQVGFQNYDQANWTLGASGSLSVNGPYDI